MESADREEEIQLLVDESDSSSNFALCQCRICHEEEDEEATTMEAPCACSGTLKFAHRGCIQRWCDEKGSTVCEICLQKFEPGYTLPPKVSHLVDVVVTIRGSLEVPRRNYNPHSSASDSDLSDYDDPECSPTTERGASFYRWFALLVTVMLLIRHLIAISLGADHYAFTLTTVFLLRASGIILPFYMAMRIISAIQHAQWQQRRRLGLDEEDVEIDQHRIPIQP